MEMGMTDKQFNGFLRMLLDRLAEARDEKQQEKKDERIEKIIEDLQRTIED